MDEKFVVDGVEFKRGVSQNTIAKETGRIRLKFELDGKHVRDEDEVHFPHGYLKIDGTAKATEGNLLSKMFGYLSGFADIDALIKAAEEHKAAEGGDVEDEDLIETCAELAHEMNRGYCKALGDESQPAWADAPEWQKESARNGVRAKLANPDTTPEQSHQGWMKEKEEAGWKYGPVKDPAKKEHPCFVPYEELPEAQKAKDFIFLTSVQQGQRLYGLIKKSS